LFFYIIPLGIESIKIERVFIAYMILAVIIYRFLLSFLFPEIQIPIVTYLQNPSLSAEFISATYQSIITPNGYPDWVTVIHATFCFLSTVALIFFWMFFGSSMEMRLGKLGFLGLLVGAIVVGLGIGLFPLATLGPTFWIGHVATLFLIGVCGMLFLTEDVKMYYHVMAAFLGSSAGKFTIPVPLPLFIIALIMILPTGVMFYEQTSEGLPMRLSVIPPWAWSISVIFMGLIVGYLLTVLLPAKEKDPDDQFGF
jgi:hypothetical protein